MIAARFGPGGRGAGSPYCAARLHLWGSSYDSLTGRLIRQPAWHRAIKYYLLSLATKERIGDAPRMVETHGNLALYHQAHGDADRAARYGAQAYLIFSQLVA